MKTVEGGVQEAVNLSKGRGSTTVLVNAALESGSILVVATSHQAYAIKQKHPELDVISQTQLPEYVVGKEQPVIFDTDLVGLVAGTAVEAGRSRVRLSNKLLKVQRALEE